MSLWKKIFRAREDPNKARQVIDAAQAHFQAGRLDEAERLCRGLLEADPRSAEALHLFGLIAGQSGREELSFDLLGAARALSPGDARMLCSLGDAQRRLRRLGEALDCYERALAVQPDSAEALLNRAETLHELGRIEEALAAYDLALARQPDHAGALSHRGVALQALRRQDEALKSYDRSLDLRPDHAGTWFNRGTALAALDRDEQALASYDRARTIDPGYAEAWNNRSAALMRLLRFEEALASAEKALALRPDFAQAWVSAGASLLEMRRVPEAMERFARAMTIAPDYGAAHWSWGYCALLRGDFERGWPEHEWRWSAFPFAQRNFPQSAWLGEGDIAGKTILLHTEQGLGDTLQFLRYALAVVERGARVLLEVQPALQPLLAGLPRRHPGIAQVLARGEPLPPFDLHCALLSLPLAFRTRMDSIPAPIPYIEAGEGALAKWRERVARVMGDDAPALKIGIAWSGNPANPNDRQRSIPLALLVPLVAPLMDSGAWFFSLHNEVRAADEPALRAMPRLAHFGSELRDFADTAGLAGCMDLVLSTDTSAVHLAGAMGLPVWVLLRHAADWRWLEAREDSPWYPTARLFRQPARGDWDSVIARVLSELRDFRGGAA